MDYSDTNVLIAEEELFQSLWTTEEEEWTDINTSNTTQSGEKKKKQQWHDVKIRPCPRQISLLPREACSERMAPSALSGLFIRVSPSDLFIR